MRKFRKVKKLPDGRPTKFVRIDPRTTIEVSVDIPDNVAKTHYLENRATYAPTTRLYERESHYILRD